jgi:uncharacterized membrane protein (UPF0127 family)
VRTLVLAAAVVTVIAAACGDGGSPPRATQIAPSPTPAASLHALELRFPGGVLNVELATTEEERALGLGGRDALPADAGMLFDLGTTRVPRFSMRGMRFPIDMIWVGEDRRIVAVTADVPVDVPGGPRRGYSPPQPVRYVLEVNAGDAARRGLAPGMQLDFELPS